MFLAGCSIFTPNTQPILEELYLLPPQYGPEEVLLKQKVTMEAAGKQRQFLAVLKLDRAKTQMIALLPTGQQILVLTYDGQSLKQESHLEVDVPGKEILAMMQLALWPEETLSRYYHSSLGWSINIDQQHRLLNNTEGTLVEVVFREHGLELKNRLRNYRVRIETLEEQYL